MDIIYRRDGRKWIAEVWDILSTDSVGTIYAEQTYQEVNQWCIENFGYHARTAYHVFEFKKKADLEWFVLKWA
jgi:hypothetical protein